MAASMNRQILLESRPEGAPSLDNFELAQRPMPEPADGEVLIRTRYLSVDPYMRGRMRLRNPTPGRSGSAIPWWAAPSARMVVSRHPKFAVGDIVLSHGGWQDYAGSNGGGPAQARSGGGTGLDGARHARHARRAWGGLVFWLHNRYFGAICVELRYSGGSGMSARLRRMTAPVNALLLALCCVLGSGSSATCAESSFSQPQDVVRRYEFGIFGVHYQPAYAPVDEALERSVARYGPYKVESVATEMSLARLHKEAVKGELVNVVVLPPGNREIDEGMTPIEIPLDKGLWGYQVGIIRATDQARVDQVRDITGLRQLRIGERQQLIKVPIYEYNDIHLVTDARDYDSLVQMLEHERFDLISRPAPVVFQEFDSYVSKHPAWQSTGICFFTIHLRCTSMFPSQRRAWLNGSGTGCKRCRRMAV